MIYQSLDGVINRVIAAKKMSDVKPQINELKQLLNHFKMAKKHFKNGNMDFVDQFFTYYVTSEDSHDQPI